MLSLRHALSCGSLNVIDLHKLIGIVIIKRCVFVGVGVVLYEEVYHHGGGEVSYAQDTIQSLSLLPVVSISICTKPT